MVIRLILAKAFQWVRSLLSLCHIQRLHNIKLLMFYVFPLLLFRLLIPSISISGSKYSASFGKHSRSRSCSSVRCNVCKHRHRDGIKTSESMHQTPLVTFSDQNRNKARSSLPDLRLECTCGGVRGRNARCSASLRFGDSCGSTESLIDEAEDFLCKSIDGVLGHDDDTGAKGSTAVNRRCSENDIKRGKANCQSSI